MGLRADYSTGNIGPAAGSFLAAVLVLALVLVGVGNAILTSTTAPVTSRTGGGGRPSATEASSGVRADVAPCIGQLGQITLLFNYSGGTVQDCFYPTGQVPLGGGNVCSLSWQFPVPQGASVVEVTNLPVGPWSFEAAGPGNVSFIGNTVVFLNYYSSATEQSSIFMLQMVGPCYEDPYVAGLGASIANLTARVASIGAEVATLLADLNGLNVTTQAKIAGVQFLVSQALEEENATYSYKLIGGSPTRSGNTFSFPIFATLMNGGIANATLTGQICRGLSVTFVNATEAVPVNWTSSSCGTGRLSITVPLTGSQAAQTTSGSAILTLTAPVQAGTFTNLAGGVLSSQQFSAATSPGDWWSTLFGITTPPPAQNLSSAQDVVEDLAWWGDSTAGRAMYALTTIIAVLVYLYAAHEAARERLAAKAAAERASKVKEPS